MTQQVPVEGFAVPPAQPGTHERGQSQPGVHLPPPPSQQVPGFVPQAPAAPAAAQPTVAELRAMLAAAEASQLPAQPQAQPQQPQHNQSNFLDGAADDPMLESLTSMLVGTYPQLDQERAISKALAYGDPELIDFAYLREIGGANAKALENLARGVVNYTVQQANAREQAVYASAGGQANWQAAVAEFGKSAPAHLKLAVKTMFDSGQSASVDAAAKTVLEYAKASGAALVPAGLVQSGATASTALALDKFQFQAELRKLDKHAPNFEQLRGELFARRQLGKQSGR